MKPCQTIAARAIGSLLFAILTSNLATADVARKCLVVAVSDGDTLRVRCGELDQLVQITIRISAIDAPEKKMPFGLRAKQALSELCYQSQATITPKALDRYHRTVAEVNCAGKDVGTEMVSNGFAWVYDRYAHDYEYLYPLQSTARANKLGLWSDPLPTRPWEWRHSKK